MNIENDGVGRARIGAVRPFVDVREAVAVWVGQGVERISPVHSPRIDGFKIIRKGAVRRAKLYYLREAVGNAAKIKEKKEKQVKK